MKNKLAIIPARGGSKRIPRKNIKEFLGKPIIAYSIEAAILSKMFDEVMVSTDDTEIVEVAKQYGAKVPFIRSKKNADDFATTYDVLEEVLLNYKNRGQEFEYACCIYPCAPFVSSEKLKKTFEILIKNNYDTVFPIMSFSFPIQRALKVSENKRVVMFDEKYLLNRSQDLERAYHDAGQFYWFQVDKILENKKILTDNSGYIEITEVDGQDIDNEMDWKLAEIKYKYFRNESR